MTRRWLLGGGAVLLLLLLLAGAGAGWLYTELDAPGPLPEARAVVVPHSGTEAIAAELAGQGVIARPSVFRALAFATSRHGPLHAAELAFPAHASLRHVLAILRTGRPVQHRLTIPEGLTAVQVQALVNAADALSGTAPLPAEGSILPDTYNYERDTAREQLMDRARTAMDHAVAAAWDARSPGLPLVSPAELVTLASIVERETAKPAERPAVAAVYLNRLRLGMKLQSDPTVVYGASGGTGQLGHPILRSDLDRDGLYNTYRVAGLPPGPICMPGLASLRAAAQPSASTALYFVADGTGGHVFARTPEEHGRNVARWREIERARALPPAPVPVPIPVQGATP